MIRAIPGLLRAAAPALLFSLLAGCDNSVVDASGDAGLDIELRLSPAATVASVDQYRIHIDGPTDRIITGAPGTSRTIDGLAPGTYTVSLEGLLGGEVETFGETSNVRVVAGENTSTSVAVNSFVPGFTVVPVQAVERQPFNFSFSGVSGATAYIVEWWPGDDVGVAQSQEVSGTSVSITVPESGPYTVRVRAKNRFGSVGRGSNTFVLDVADGPPVLLHRWSFSETGEAGTILVDDVGGADGMIVDVGTSNAVAQSGRVTLAGGASDAADYVSLPPGLISGLSDLSIEIWATPISAKAWGRVFDFGAGEQDFFMMSWSIGADGSRNQLEWRTPQGGGQRPEDVVPAFELGTEVHIVVTIDDDGGPFTEMRVYLDGEFQGTYPGPPSIDAIADDRNWLGRSQYVDDATANASYNEVRIWDGALSDAEVMASFTGGPVADDMPLPGPPLFHLYPTGVDDFGQLLGPAEVDRHYTLVEWPVSPVPDVIAIPIDGTTPGEDDPNDYPGGPWLPNSATARWIGPDNADTDQDAFGPAGQTVYRTTLTVPPGVDPASVRIEGTWVSDNDQLGIALNGVEIPQSALGDQIVAPFVVQGPFVGGLNTLDFRVFNGGGPTGLQVDNLVVTYQSEPGSYVVVTPSRVRMGYIGAGVALDATILSDFLPPPGSNPSLSWSTSDPGVATVDASGLVQTTGRGSAIITATFGSFEARVRVDVAPDFTNPIVFGGHTYALGPALPWQAASDLAEAYGGHLVSVTSDPENQALVHPQFGQGRKWLGFNDIVEENTYVWSDDSSVTFTAWQPGEPNSQAEDCAVHEGAAGSWNDVPCAFAYPGLIEWDWTGNLPVDLSDVRFGFDGSRYASTAFALTWVQARNLAEALGATLVSIGSPEEQRFLETAFPLDQDEFWIGLDDRAQEGRFVDPWGGLPLFTNWNDTEPNNANGEGCTHTLTVPLGRWNDFSCDRTRNAIFEWTYSSPAGAPLGASEATPPVGRRR